MIYMSILDEQRKPLRSPVDRPGDSSQEEQPADIPEYCRGVEVHPDEPYHSFRDGMAKSGMLVRMSLDDNSDKIEGLDNTKAALYWLDRAEKFHIRNAVVSKAFSNLKPLLEELVTRIEENKREGTGELLERIIEADDALERAFQR
jgi:hypothetical protein